MIRNRKISLLIVFCSVVAITAAVVVILGLQRYNSVYTNSSLEAAIVLNTEEMSIVEEEKEEIAAIELSINPITGILEQHDKEHFYYAVIIDNLKAARPQYGISLAPLVYEMPAEGGVTRFLAVFDSGNIEKIGPVRSARPYFIDKAREHGNLMLIHCGGSPQALSIISKESYPAMNEISNGAYFFRDNTRKAPHNLFVSAEQILKFANIKKYSLTNVKTGFDFGFIQDQYLNIETISKVSLKYYTGYSVHWKYDAESNLYVRYINDMVHTDAGNSENIKASNVIIPIMSYKVLDSEGRIEFTKNSSGDCIVLTGGTKRTCKWIRTSNETIVFEDEKGLIKLAEGTTWIQIIPNKSSISYE